jgi:phosphonate transport system ATP-binding protein
MDALAAINRDLGITVLCNLHSLDIARSYCQRLVGMTAGRIVFDGVPAALTEDLVSELYGIEALGVQAASTPHDGQLGVVLPFAKVALAH